MKTKNIFSKFLFACALTSAVVLISSCSKDDDNNNNNAKTYTLSGNGSGAQESPAVTTTGTSTFTGTYNSGTNKMDYTINWTSISGVATSVRLYSGASAGQNATVFTDLTIGVNGTSGSSSGSVTLSDSSEAQLLSGKMYYNIHTATNINGEVRGQISATAN